MKIILILYCFTPFFAFGQVNIVDGNYYPIKKDRGYVNYLLEIKNAFVDVSVNHDTGKKFGKGNYLVDKDFLIINFSNYAHCPIYELKSAKSIWDNDSITVNIKVFNDTITNPLNGVNLLIKKSNIFTFSDSQGKGTLRVSKNKESFSVIVSFVGFDNIEIPVILQNGTTQNFNVNLTSNYYYNSDDTLKFKIVKVTSDYLILTSRATGKIKYEKISDEEKIPIIGK
ncbi:carboxypeptidase-like regulatory domain-containing protein [Xanthovirga aplysinae]|uniref:carboxypeptidase-like regulatory domain-containing protein n=1 Tax=Xanthovirga aplysinae TaxID=2529853 RepID=UPI0012BB7DC9|nr:carboxypeptidase-like regulatory domain-containing protein [Xanthovirga aplysinae]MTI30825.1 hypothetical protein [Xanthovirga aplysinae]